MKQPDTQRMIVRQSSLAQAVNLLKDTSIVEEDDYLKPILALAEAFEDWVMREVKE